MILAVEPLGGDRHIQPLPVDSPLAVAHAAAIEMSGARLSSLLPTEFGLRRGEPSSATPVMGKFQDRGFGNHLDAWPMVEHAAAQWLRTDWNAPIGMALEASGRPDASEALLPSALGHDPLPARAMGRLVTYLDDGYVLALHGATDRHAGIQMLLEDLERALGVAIVDTMFVGLRTAIGALPEASTYPRIMIQLEGRRHVSMSADEDESGHVNVPKGSVLLVPAGYVVRHRPLDEDTIHLEITLSSPEVGTEDGELVDDTIEISSEMDSIWRAWLPARGVGSMRLMAHALTNQAWDRVAVRSGIPGGVFAVANNPDRYAAGGFEFTLAPAGVAGLARLMVSEPVAAAEFDAELLEGLLRAGLLSVYPLTESAAG